ncbi:MAG: hypothetical protein M3M96_03015 [Candidatus Eremiobacteraeota bacterium]|nr:hypothetical protein [Candidatus Eremiobacteraeota bacterium]
MADKESISPGVAAEGKQKHYDVVAERNRGRLDTLSRLARKTVWAEYYLPVRPRSVTVALISGFRSGATRGVDKNAYREQAAAVTAIALADAGDARAAPAIAEALEYGRHRFGFHLNEPPWDEPDGVLLTGEEMSEADALLRSWLLDTLAEFGPTA